VKANSVKLIHFSPQSGLSTIDPSMMGRGVRSEEYKRGLPGIARSYYYRADTQYEPIVTEAARSKYTTYLSPEEHIYDLSDDTKGLVQQALKENQGAWNSDIILGKIKAAGFHGFSNKGSRLPHVVALFYPKKIHHEEPIVKSELQELLAKEQYLNLDPETQMPLKSVSECCHVVPKSLQKLLTKHQPLRKEVFAGGNPLFHGWIDPNGKYYHMDPDVMHMSWIYNHAADNNLPILADSDWNTWQKALEHGWGTVGIAGAQVINNQHLTNPTHPSTLTARKYIEKYWDGPVEFYYKDHEGKWIHNVGDARHFAKYGVIKPVISETKD
jgi:hypothetical protein